MMVNHQPLSLTAFKNVCGKDPSLHPVSLIERRNQFLTDHPGPISPDDHIENRHGEFDFIRVVKNENPAVPDLLPTEANLPTRMDAFNEILFDPHRVHLLNIEFL